MAISSEGWIVAPSSGAGDGRRLGAELERVVQRFQRDLWAVLAPQGLQQQVIREPRVLGQQRTVHVGAETVAIAGAFLPILAVVTEALQHAAKGLAFAQARPS